MDLLKVFIVNSLVDQSSLRKIVKKNGIIKYSCKKCGNEGFHNGLPLVLQLDHENGDGRDNRIENLRWLCPNCHTQTPTYSRAKSGPTKETERRGTPFIKLECANCNVEFLRRKSTFEYRKNGGVKNVYCSNKCKSSHWRKLNGNFGPGGHGTLAGYFHCPKPRCEPCLKAMRDHKSERRRSNRGIARTS
jgi:hypothetical protein